MLVDSEFIYRYKKSIGMKQNTEEEERVEHQKNSLDASERKHVRQLRFQRCLQKAEQ
jgi:hypothetical protein